MLIRKRADLEHLVDGGHGVRKIEHTHLLHVENTNAEGALVTLLLLRQDQVLEVLCVAEEGASVLAYSNTLAYLYRIGTITVE